VRSGGAAIYPACYIQLRWVQELGRTLTAKTGGGMSRFAQVHSRKSGFYSWRAVLVLSQHICQRQPTNQALSFAVESLGPQQIAQTTVR
jgi:hypothetical protein